MNNVKQKPVSLNDKVTQVLGSINFEGLEEKDYEKISRHFFEVMDDIRYITGFYFILHYDTQTPHIHYCCFLKSQTHLSTILNSIAEPLIESKWIRNETAINITKLGSINATLKYWLHQTVASQEDGKKPYPKEDIHTNEGDFMVDGYLTARDDDDFNLYMIKDLVIRYQRLSEVLLRLPERVSKSKRWYIETIWKDRDYWILEHNRLPF